MSTEMSPGAGALAEGRGRASRSVPGDPAWFHHAACIGHADDHFPEEPVTERSLRLRRARRRCLMCPVRRECLVAGYGIFTHPLSGDERTAGEHGVWGGTTPQERKRVRHLDIDQRIAILEAWVRSFVVGRYAVAHRSEMTSIGG